MEKIRVIFVNMFIVIFIETSVISSVFASSTSDYKNIRVNLYAGNGNSTAWLCNKSGVILTGSGTRECNAKLGLKTYYEFYTGSTTNNNIVIKYMEIVKMLRHMHI